MGRVHDDLMIHRSGGLSPFARGQYQPSRDNVEAMEH